MGFCFAGARAPSLLLLSGSGLKFTLSDMPKGFGTSHVGNTGKGSGKGHAGGTGGKGQGTGGKTGGPPQVSKGAGKHGQNKHVKGSVGWQAACDAYARVIGQPAAAGESVAAGAKAQQFWACRGPGGCQHDKNPGGPSGTKVCLSCGLPWEYSARPAFWAGLAARQSAKAAAGNGNGTPGKGARRPPPGGAGAPPAAGGTAGGGGPADGAPPSADPGTPPARPPGPLATAAGLAALVGLLGVEDPAVAEYKIKLQKQATPAPPPVEPAGAGRTQEGLAQLRKLLGHEHEACQAYAEGLRREKDELLLPEQRVAGKVRYSAILENRKVKAQARVDKANEALASAQAEADASAERLTAVEGQIATITEEIQALMSAVPEEPDDAVMATGGGDTLPLSTQALMEALQAKVRVDLGGETDQALMSVQATLLDLLVQAQAAIAQLPRRPGPVPTDAEPVSEAAGAPAAGQASGQSVAKGSAGAVVAGLRGNFEPVEHGKHMQQVGPY